MSEELVKNSDEFAKTITELLDGGRQVKDTDIIAAIAPDAVSLMDKAIAEIKRLRQENATLTAERDEARRLWCVDIGELYSSSPLSLAKERGWDCFKEGGK